MHLTTPHQSIENIPKTSINIIKSEIMKQNTIRTDTPPHSTDGYRSPVLAILTISGETGFATSTATLHETANDSYTIDDETFTW